MVEQGPQRIGKFVEWVDTWTNTQEIFRDLDGRITQLNILTEDGELVEGNKYIYNDRGRMIKRFNWETWDSDGRFTPDETFEERIYEYRFKTIEINDEPYPVILEVAYGKNETGEWSLYEEGLTAKLHIPKRTLEVPKVEIIPGETLDRISFITSPYILNGQAINYKLGNDGSSLTLYNDKDRSINNYGSISTIPPYKNNLIGTPLRPDSLKFSPKPIY